MIQSCCCWHLNRRGKKSWNVTAHHPAICHASAAPRSSHMLQTELDRTRPDWAKLTQAGTFYTAQDMDHIFPLQVSSPPWTLLTFPLFHVSSLFPFHVQRFAKNSKTKKIFLLISCLLQRFYFVLKKEKRNKNKSSLEEFHNCAAID